MGSIMEDFTRFKRLSFQSYPKESESESERAAFLNFIEESGANAVLIEAVSLLFKTVEKPDNPMQWLRLYFLNQLPSGGSEEVIQESEAALKNDIIQQESKLTCLQVEAHRLEDRLLMLGLKAQHIEFRSPIITNEEEYRRYKDMPEDLRWRIKPDPAFRVTKSDVTLHVQANEDFQKRATMGPGDFGGESKAKDYENDAVENYDDYNQLYFAANGIPQPPPPTVEPDDFEADVVGGKRETNYSVAATEVGDQRGNTPTGTGRGNKSSEGQSGRVEVEVGLRSSGEGEEQRSQPKSVSGDSEGRTKKEVGGTETEGDPDVATEVKAPPKSSISEGKLNRKTSSRKSVSGGTSEEGGTKNDLPYTPDPMLAIMEPIDSSFWTRSFNVATHVNDGDFDADEDDVVLYNDGEDGDEEQMSYVGFTGVRKQRKFRSQIIGERFWKPDRGKSIYLDEKYDLLLHEHVAGLASRQSDSKFGNRGSQEDGQKEAPSTIAVELSENSMLARELLDNRQRDLRNDGRQ